LCRRTRQIVGYWLGTDRSAASCQLFRDSIAPSYQGCQTVSDFLESYPVIFPAETHQCVGKETGETNHIERWNLTLRQRIARFCRKTLSFSKSWLMHYIAVTFFVERYNADRVAVLT